MHEPRSTTNWKRNFHEPDGFHNIDIQIFYPYALSSFRPLGRRLMFSRLYWRKASGISLAAEQVWRPLSLMAALTILRPDFTSSNDAVEWLDSSWGADPCWVVISFILIRVRMRPTCASRRLNVRHSGKIRTWRIPRRVLCKERNMHKMSSIFELEAKGDWVKNRRYGQGTPCTKHVGEVVFLN